MNRLAMNLSVKKRSVENRFAESRSAAVEFSKSPDLSGLGRRTVAYRVQGSAFSETGASASKSPAVVMTRRGFPIFKGTDSAEAMASKIRDAHGTKVMEGTGITD
jgi:hypothetical protein